MRLIDADALKKAMYHEAFEKDSDEQKWESGCWIRYEMFERNLKNAPTVDAVPVVRCKDCVYFEPENAEEGDSYGRCRNNYAPCQNQQVEMMWFCADGEREEGR